MYTPFTSKHFTSYTDESGIKISVLETRVERVQQVIYFVNSGYTNDGRYLWFMVTDPESSNTYVANIDFLTDEIQIFPDVKGTGHYVDLETGDIYWSCSRGIMRHSPRQEDGSVLVAPMPSRFAEAGSKCNMCHLTPTPDKRELLTEYSANGAYYIGSVNVENGVYTQWLKIDDGGSYDHVQCSPTDANLVMFAREMWNGEKLCVEPVYIDGIFPRIQFATRSAQHHIIRLAGNDGGHEWFAPDGKSVYHVNNNFENKGYGVVAKCSIYGGEPEIILKASTEEGCNHVWHAYCSEDEELFVFDSTLPSKGLPVWRGCASTVQFFNKRTGKYIRFLTCNPALDDWSPENQCKYHIDPHPRFVLKDKYITFTTTVKGKVDLAVADVSDLIEATK